MSADFGWAIPEEQHRKQAIDGFPDAINAISGMLMVIAEAFHFMSALPVLEARDARTAMAGLFSRSLKSLTCAADLTLRGYYTQATMLIRAVHEDRLIQWDLGQRPEAIDDLLDSEWPRDRGFRAIARAIDEWLQEAGFTPAEVKLYDERYSPLSETAHPRGPGLRLEFNVSGTALNAHPMWDKTRCLQTLGDLGIGISMVIGSLMQFLAPNKDAADWHAKCELAVGTWRAWFDNNVKGELRPP